MLQIRGRALQNPSCCAPMFFLEVEEMGIGNADEQRTRLRKMF